MKIPIVTLLLILGIYSCNQGGNSQQKSIEIKQNTTQPSEKIVKDTSFVEVQKKPTFQKHDPLTTQSAIPFFFQYAKEHKQNRVRMTTSEGVIEIELFDKTPYHRANFIFLASQGYFNGTCFHRVVKNFIIQGGNSDTWEVAKRRQQIGHYLLPPDTKKGYKHHRGVLSMPSSEIDNPHQFASPYEFFIVVQKPGAYHLDGKYTVFAKVTKGMDVVDRINAYQTDQREWPKQNIIIQKVEVLNL